MALLLSHSIYRDSILESQNPGDLRNRVVGARLINDGKLPYSYSWQGTDSIRYYDYNNIHSESGISNITASPFFHQLFNPLFELPQRTVSIIWTWLQYFFLIIMIIMIRALTSDNITKWLIINFGIIFTATEAWKFLIASGQLYLFTGFLMCMILYMLSASNRLLLILSGIITVVFVLTRPIAIIIFVPFLFYYKSYLVYLSVSFSLLGIYMIFILTSPIQKPLYKDYFNAIRLHVKFYQEAQFEKNIISAPKVYQYKVVEGFNTEEMYRSYKEHPIKIYSENGNISALYYNLTHRKPSLILLYGLLAGTIFFLSISFIISHGKLPPNNLQIILFGFTLYLIVEFYTPIYRHQYYTVQWLPIILASFLLFSERKNMAFLLLIAGLLLNICNFDWLLMRHTIGECCWLTAILMLVFSSNYNLPAWKKQS